MTGNGAKCLDSNFLRWYKMVKTQSFIAKSSRCTSRSYASLACRCVCSVRSWAAPSAHYHTVPRPELASACPRPRTDRQNRGFSPKRSVQVLSHRLCNVLAFWQQTLHLAKIHPACITRLCVTFAERLFVCGSCAFVKCMSTDDMRL